MVGGNAALVYGFDLTQLQAVADRIGPEVDAVYSGSRRDSAVDDRLSRLGPARSASRNRRQLSPPRVVDSSGAEALADGSLEDPERRAQRRLGHDREALLDVAAHLRPVVVRGHVGDAVVAGLEAVPVEVRDADVRARGSRRSLGPART